MYVLRKNGKIIKESRNLKDCATILNRLARFKIVDNPDVNNFVWIDYKEYSLKYERRSK